MARATWGSTDLGGTIGLLHAGAKLRVAHWPAPEGRAGSPAGTVIVVTGRGEFIECYGEAIADLRRLGFAVVAFDLRGQGGSSRKSRVGGHVDAFRDYVDDITAVVRHAGQLGLPRPVTVLAHSMGGLAALLAQPHLAREVDRMVLLAPMLEVKELPGPAGLLHALAWGACLIGLARKPARKPQPAMGAERFASNRVTSDPVRYGWIAALSAANPDLCVGAPTFGWIRASLSAMGRARRQIGKPLAIPTLFVASAADKVVSTAAIDRFARATPGGGMVLVREARHQLLMERDSLRGLFFAAFKAFLADATRRNGFGPSRQRRAKFVIGSQGDPDRVLEGWKLPGRAAPVPGPAAPGDLDRPAAPAPAVLAEAAPAAQATPAPAAAASVAPAAPTPAAPIQAAPAAPVAPAPAPPLQAAPAAPVAPASAPPVEIAPAAVPVPQDVPLQQVAAASEQSPPPATPVAGTAQEAQQPHPDAAFGARFNGASAGWLGAEEDDRDVVLSLGRAAFTPHKSPPPAETPAQTPDAPDPEPAPEPILRASKAERLARRQERTGAPDGEETASRTPARTRLLRRLRRDSRDPEESAPHAEALLPPAPYDDDAGPDWTVRPGEEPGGPDDEGDPIVPRQAILPPNRRDPLGARRPRRR